jgi:hypothetical protein
MPTTGNREAVRGVFEAGCWNRGIRRLSRAVRRSRAACDDHRSLARGVSPQAACEAAGNADSESESTDLPAARTRRRPRRFTAASKATHAASSTEQRFVRLVLEVGVARARTLLDAAQAAAHATTSSRSDSDDDEVR